MENEWIYWDGGECPVERGTLVDVEFRNGQLMENYPADEWIWSKYGESDDIIAYRLSEVEK